MVIFERGVPAFFSTNYVKHTPSFTSIKALEATISTTKTASIDTNIDSETKDIFFVIVGM